jgi:large subunit ribosomal protein L20
MRSLWITRINAAAREHGLKYGDFMHGMSLASINLDRKVLSEMAITEPVSFGQVAAKAKAALLVKHGLEIGSGSAQASK